MQGRRGESGSSSGSEPAFPSGVTGWPLSLPELCLPEQGRASAGPAGPAPVWLYDQEGVGQRLGSSSSDSGQRAKAAGPRDQAKSIRAGGVDPLLFGFSAWGAVTWWGLCSHQMEEPPWGEEARAWRELGGVRILTLDQASYILGRHTCQVGGERTSFNSLLA